MHVLRRLVWWKCLFWILAGVAAGAAAATLLPEPGAPAVGTRLSAETLVLTLTGNKADTISHVVLYPPRRQVQLVRFDYRSDKGPTAGYAYANTPLLTARELQGTVDDEALLAARTARVATPPRASPSVLQRLFGGASAKPAAAQVAKAEPPTPAATALADIKTQPRGQWATATAFFDHVRAKRPAFAYTSAWWTTDRWRVHLPMAAGAVVFGLVGGLLTRRSAADLAAANLLRNTRVAASAGPQASGAKDLAAVEALDNLMAAELARSAADGDTVLINNPPSPSVTPVLKLDASPVAATTAAEQEAKDYAGEFYPTVRRGGPKAFSLVELLVVIGVIGVLIAVLLPALVGAKRSANTIVCASNLRAISQGMAVYLAQNHNTFPPAYLYIGHKIEGGVQTPTSPAAGYVHWSSYLYGNGTVGKDAFKCPAMPQGGLPPTNTPPANRDPDQNVPSETVVDQQAPRLAFTVNEVLFPRNKFITRSFGSSRTYRFVKSTEVANASGTIMGTEMINNPVAISYGDNRGWIMSHRPLSAFVALDGTLDMYEIPVGQKFRPATTADLDADPDNIGDSTHTRLDLVGRNHGRKSGYPDTRLSNFVYVDGHVETKSVYDTLLPAFEWGEKFYSLTPNDDQVAADYVAPMP